MIDVVKPDGAIVSWPLLTPITNFSEYMPSYFENRYGSTENVFYVSLPPEADGSMESVGQSILDSLTQNPEIVFVYDEIDGQSKIETIRNAINAVDQNIVLEEDLFIDPKNGTPASSIHFSGLAIVNKDVLTPSKNIAEAYEYLISNGEVSINSKSKTILIEPTSVHESLLGQEDKTVLGRLWDIYESQFNRLVENHPARGAQTFEEFRSMVEDSNTYTIAHMVEDDLVAFALFVSDINACDWLNADFYDKTFQNEPILYFPGIASDINKKGEIFSLHIVNLISQLEHQIQRDVRILFQCTNISADYIPYKIVEPAINSTGLGSISISEMLRYNYRAFEVKK
jgi:hypothetical protein